MSPRTCDDLAYSLGRAKLEAEVNWSPMHQRLRGPDNVRWPSQLFCPLVSHAHQYVLHPNGHAPLGIVHSLCP